MELEEFIGGVIAGLKLQDNEATRGFFRGLAGAEGTTARNNPFATSKSLGRGETKFNSHGVKNYQTPQDGIEASVRTFKLSYYRQVVSALKQGNLQKAAYELSRSPYVGGSQAVRDQHANNILTHAGSGSTQALSAQYSAKLGPGADRDGVTTKGLVLQYANAIANVYGKNITIGTGTQHRQYVNNNPKDGESEHWHGNAGDIPATGEELTKLGQAALISAGMPVEQARKQTGGVFNVNGYQILFNTNTGGNHFDHLHIGVGRAKVPPVGLPEGYPTPATPSPDTTPSQPEQPKYEPIERAPIPSQAGIPQNGPEVPGSGQLSAPVGRDPLETWQLISSQPYVSPETQQIFGDQWQ